MRLTLTAHNDLEYLAIEDPRPAGCEPVDRLSGWFWQQSLGGRREVRDDRTAFFVARLVEGEHVIEYDENVNDWDWRSVGHASRYVLGSPYVDGVWLH